MDSIQTKNNAIIVNTQDGNFKTIVPRPEKMDVVAGIAATGFFGGLTTLSGSLSGITNVNNVLTLGTTLLIITTVALAIASLFCVIMVVCDLTSYAHLPAHSIRKYLRLSKNEMKDIKGQLKSGSASVSYNFQASSTNKDNTILRPEEHESAKYDMAPYDMLDANIHDDLSREDQHFTVKHSISKDAVGYNVKQVITENAGYSWDQSLEALEALA